MGGLLLPIARHAYVGGRAKVTIGIIYTASGATLMPLGIIFGLGDDGLIPFLFGTSVNLVSVIDAGISASKHNEKIRKQGFKLNFTSNPRNKSYLLTLS